MACAAFRIPGGSRAQDRVVGFDTLSVNAIPFLLATEFGRAALFISIAVALEELKGHSNRTAWKYLAKLMPSAERRRRLAGMTGTEVIGDDAINDLGTDNPEYATVAVKRYARDPKIRAAVKQRANGKCEYCGEPISFSR